MFPLIERDFPFIYVSPPTVHRLRQKQLQQVTALTRSRVSQRTGAVKKMAEMEQKQKVLLHIIKQELDHTEKMVSLIDNKWKVFGESIHVSIARCGIQSLYF